MYTYTKERMAPEVLFLTKHMSQISIIDLKVEWLLCIVLFSPFFQSVLNEEQWEKASAINPVTENTDDWIDCYLQM